MNQICSTKSVKNFGARLLDSGYGLIPFWQRKSVRFSGWNVPRVWTFAFQMTSHFDQNLAESKWLVSGELKEKCLPCFLVPQFWSRVLAREGEWHGAGEACCMRAVLGIHVGLGGKDRALSPRPAYLVCVNNFAQLVVCFMFPNSSTLIVTNSISISLSWERDDLKSREG